MIEKIIVIIKGICLHVLSGCSVCGNFARHFGKTLVQILKGSDTYQKS